MFDEILYYHITNINNYGFTDPNVEVATGVLFSTLITLQSSFRVSSFGMQFYLGCKQSLAKISYFSAIISSIEVKMSIKS